MKDFNIPNDDLHTQPGILPIEEFVVEWGINPLTVPPTHAHLDDPTPSEVE